VKVGDEMAKTKTSSAVKDRWNSTAYDEIKLRVIKGRKAKLKAAAKSSGDSLNGFINQAIDYYMSDDEYCQQLYENYLASEDKDDFIPLEEFAESLGFKR